MQCSVAWVTPDGSSYSVAEQCSHHKARARGREGETKNVQRNGLTFQCWWECVMKGSDSPKYGRVLLSKCVAHVCVCTEYYIMYNDTNSNYCPSIVYELTKQGMRHQCRNVFTFCTERCVCLGLHVWMYVCEIGDAYGCFLWENGRSEVRGRWLRVTVRSDSGQLLLNEFLHSSHLLHTNPDRQSINRSTYTAYYYKMTSHTRVGYRRPGVVALTQQMLTWNDALHIIPYRKILNYTLPCWWSEIIILCKLVFTFLGKRYIPGRVEGAHLMLPLWQQRMVLFTHFWVYKSFFSYPAGLLCLDINLFQYIRWLSAVDILHCTFIHN